MAERLVSVRASVGVGHRVLVRVDRGRRVRGGVVVAVRLGTGTERLVGVRGLLGGDTALVAAGVVVRGAAGAAADTESPEEHGGERESHGEPGGCKHVLAHVQVDAVGLQGGPEAGLEDRKEDGRGDGGGGGEEEGDDGNQGSDTATPATADGEGADQDLQRGRDKGNDVGDELPLGNGLVHLHDLVVVPGQLILDAGAVQAPDGERIKVELGLGIGARLSVEFVRGDIAVAVAPKADGVEVGQGAVLLQLVQDILHILRVDIGDASLVQHIFNFLYCLRPIAGDILEVDLRADALVGGPDGKISITGDSLG